MILQGARNLESRFDRVSSCCEIWIVLFLYNNNNIVIIIITIKQK